MEVVCSRRITTHDIVEIFYGKLVQYITSHVVSRKSYIGVKKDLNIELNQVPIGKLMLDSVYQLQHANSLHSTF